MSDKYILNDNGEPVAEPDMMKWAEWYETSRKARVVKQEQIGESRVSTVFLALDHSWMKGPPVLWETMVFGGKLDQDQARCAGNREQAEAMHREMVERVKKSDKGRVFDLE